MNDIPAFPQYKYHPDPFSHGMTLRDYFAAKAMTGLLTAEIVGEYTNEHIANISFLIADAMMKARSE
jgi:uncharacterized protein CbrC (UPF0167 family)